MEQVVFITGASSGFGKACAEHLRRRGYRVFGTSRRVSATEEAAFASDADGTTYEMLPLDVTDDGSVQRAIGRVLERAGRLDVVINNAGIGLAGAVEDTSIEEARMQLETNFFGVLRVCRAALPIMRAQRSGTIINISSLGGLVGIPFQALYSASKFALEGLSEALRLEVQPWGIRVVLIEPGDACTGFTANRRRVAAFEESAAYRERADRALAVMEADERNGFPPARLARRVEAVIRSRSPRPRYTVAPLPEAAAVALKKVVPPWLFEWGLRKYYRLD